MIREGIERIGAQHLERARETAQQGVDEAPARLDRVEPAPPRRPAIVVVAPDQARPDGPVLAGYDTPRGRPPRFASRPHI